MNKQVLRQVYLEKRKTLSAKEHERRSRLICDMLLRSFDFRVLSAVHLFMPIESQREPNTRLIYDALSTQFPHLSLIFSVSNTHKNTMSHHVVRKNTQWKKNKWGILEPVDAELFDPMLIDMVLVPLIVADKAGNRIGYGKGYYDRFLKESCQEEVITVGLSMSPLLDPLPYFEDFDKKLRYCIHYTQLTKF